ncbi:glutathione synthase [Allopseudospirillum japonicum]|uniref:Glutathione synthetase n=1 Tax=Allopseudospirillum japonicum TaxID=64971 RepID=A0A1H6TP05_9GAMM|nr:glutathione synthase [Allopseudospirillum japonicum]SEI81819.1 glutathione synthase [Allopseudospirillum japonicum]
MAAAIRVGIVMDPIEHINYKKDTSLALLLAAQARGWTLFYMQQEDLYLQQGQAYAQVRPLQVFADPDAWFCVGETQTIALATLDVILMRKDPPFDQAFLTATWLLEAAEEAGVLVVNKPQSLRDCNEKLFAQAFPQCTPPTLVSSQAALLRAFHTQHQDIILKPLDGMGGMGIFRVDAQGLNLGAIIEQLTDNGRTAIMAQKYLPEIKDGDTRILVVDGEPIPYGLARIPAQGETRGNLAAGGTGVGRELNARDYWLVEQVAPTLKAKELLFVGLDVIGGYLTEINVTSPTCVRELDRQYDLNIADRLMSAIAKRLQAQGKQP